MKNEKEFDYDKKKPNFEQNNKKKSAGAEVEKSENFSEIINKSPNSKSIEVIQRNSIVKNVKVKCIDNNKKSEKKQIITEEQNYEIITLPESEIISPDLPLDEAKKPNNNFSKNLVENIYEKQKSEIYRYN